MAASADSLLPAMRAAMPLSFETLNLGAGAAPMGLVIVDEVVGFAAPGGGNLAPPGEDADVARIVEETDRLAKRFAASKRPIFAFLDSHEPGKPEPPYPPHCERGSGEDEFMAELRWLESEPQVTLICKNCINGFVGAMSDGSNLFVARVGENDLESLLVVGICTDICVMDLVLTLLSARNHKMMSGPMDIFVYESAYATYNLSREAAEILGLSPSLAHSKAPAHHIGLFFMVSCGARLVKRIR